MPTQKISVRRHSEDGKVDVVSVTPPVVNLNGATRDSLMGQQKAVLEAVIHLQNALQDAFPHGRDFQTVPDSAEALRQAQQEAWAEADACNTIRIRHETIIRSLWEV